MNTSKINCPNCGYELQVEEILSSKAKEDAKKEMEIAMQRQSEIFNKKLEELEQEKQQFELKKKNENELFQAKLNKRLEEEKALYTKAISNEFETKINLLNKEREEANTKLLALHATNIENEQLKRKLDNVKQEAELEYERMMTEQLKAETEKIRKLEFEKSELKIRERETLINQMKEQMDEMKRKAEQGSMQLQGEVQELALEELLRRFFAVDIISEVPKGVTGADVLQTVLHKGLECGKIVYESKRTKTFSPEWIKKLKTDAALVKADVCVIVTETLPDDIDKIGMKDGVWISSFHDIKGLVIVLRDSLIKINEAYNSQTNKGEKMQMLYDYLMSNEFKLQITNINDGFRELQKGYMDERNAMEKIWKKREKQLEKILLNTNHFIGSIQGIAGSSLPELKQIGEETDMNLIED